MSSIVLISGPRESGPGEREQMLQRAQRELARRSVDDITRIDVPAKGVATGDEPSGTALRGAVDPIVPALQSGSLFGGMTGVMVVDAQWLLKAEAEIITELIATLEGGQVVAVFVAAGAVPAPLGKALKAHAEVITVSKIRERDASDWLGSAAKTRGVKLIGDAAAALLQRFGTDLASMGQALDQLAASEEEVTGDVIRSRFKNRPDEPMWFYADAVSDGKTGEALRRLADFLQHGHPLQILGFLEGDLRRRAMASAAPDLETFAEWVGSKPDAYPVKKAWRHRSQSKASDLHKALDALSRADLTMKSAPEVMHRITMERLTVALCRWYGGSRSGR